ncbi:GspH/FimT family pseudopilin [Glaciimonas sp. GG7]
MIKTSHDRSKRDFSPGFNPGFTLIEVMIVVAIIGIFMAVAMPSFMGTTQRFRSLGEISGFTKDLQFARSVAIEQGLPATICASVDGATCSSSTSWNTGWIVFVDPLANQTVGTILRLQKSFVGTDTLVANNAVSWLTYSRDGFMVALPGTGTVTFTLHTTPVNSAATQCVAIIKTGRDVVQAAGTGACA